MNDLRKTHIRRMTDRASFLLFIGVAGIMIMGMPWGGFGITPASYAQQQKGEKRPASSDGASKDIEARKEGMESLGKLAAEQVTPEFLRTLETRRLGLQEKEKELDRRETQLRLLQRDIEEKLQRLENARTELEAMTAEVDASRLKDLGKAVQRFSAMKPDAAAEVLSQMELASVASILGKMEPEKAGSILDAMVKAVKAQSATDPKGSVAKLEALGKLGETLVFSKKPQK
jgi:flagellar motility protein MotE (MotC chaperone)